jgi:dienelactone hydrolase
VEWFTNMQPDLSYAFSLQLSAHHVPQERYTSPSRLAIEGRSAGGLLMGLLTDRRPDLTCGLSLAPQMGNVPKM